VQGQNSITVEVHELIRTANQGLVRNRSASLSCDSPPTFTYELKQKVNGSVGPAQIIDFRKTKDIAPQLCRAFTEELKKKGLASLPRQKNDIPDDTRPLTHLYGTCDNHYFNVITYGRRSDQSPARELRDRLLGAAEDLKMTRPAKGSILETEGDMKVPQNVTMTELLRHPSKYQGKRVSFVAFGAWGGGRDDMGIAVSDKAAEDYEHQFAWGAPSSVGHESPGFVDNR
jgi:hypothetical protein